MAMDLSNLIIIPEPTCFMPFLLLNLKPDNSKEIYVILYDKELKPSEDFDKF